MSGGGRGCRPCSTDTAALCPCSVLDSSAWLKPRTVRRLHSSARSLTAALCSWEPQHRSYRKCWKRGVGRRAVGPPQELSTRKSPPVRTGRAERVLQTQLAVCFAAIPVAAAVAAPPWPVKLSVPREGELCCWAGPRPAPKAQRGCLKEGREKPWQLLCVFHQAPRRAPCPAAERSTASQYMNVYFIRTDTDHDI